MRIVPIYKEKGDRWEYANYRGINILSIPEKIHGKALIRKKRWKVRKNN